MCPEIAWNYSENYYGCSNDLEVLLEGKRQQKLVEEPYQEQLETPDTTGNKEKQTTVAAVNEDNKGQHAINIQKTWSPTCLHLDVN